MLYEIRDTIPIICLKCLYYIIMYFHIYIIAYVTTLKIKIPLHFHVGVYTLNLNKKHSTVWFMLYSCSITLHVLLHITFQ